MAQYRKLVEAGADPSDVAEWMRETKAARMQDRNLPTPVSPETAFYT